jgi:hypothetical protein
MKRICESITTTELCKYGCGQVAKYKNGSGNLMCDVRSQKCPAVREKNSKNVIQANVSGKRNKYCYKNLPEETKKRMNWNKGNINADFSFNGKGNHKAVLIKERGHCCEKCKNSIWNDTPIPLELEHCDGNNKNNIKENLLLLCPNCHAQTKFYRGRNINQGIKKVSDEQIIEKLREGLNVRQVLCSLNLTPKGANYERVYALQGLTTNI